MINIHRFLLKIYFKIYFYYGYKKIKKSKSIYEIENILRKWIFNPFIVKVNDNTNHISIILLYGNTDSVIINMFKDTTKSTIKFSNLYLCRPIIFTAAEYLEKNNFLKIIENLNVK